MKFVRKISCNELLYADMQDVLHAYVTQYVMEIKTLKDEKLLEKAINAAIDFNDGSNMQLKGRSFYVAEKPIRVKRVKIRDKDLWTADFFNEGVDYREATVAAFIVLHQKKKYFVIKVSHAAMDGKGGLLLINNIFKYLNGEELVHYDNALTDRALLKQLPYKSFPEPKFPKLKPKNSKVIKKFETSRRVITLDGYTNSIIAKIAKVFAEEFDEDEVRFMIPSDLRRHRRGENHCGNLVLPIMLKVNKGDSVATINGKMLMGLKNKDELNIRNTSYFGYNYLPKFLRNAFLRMATTYANKLRKFSIAGVITYLGRIKIDGVMDFLSMPPAEPLGPFIASIVECNNKTNIVLCYYKDQYSEDYIDKLCGQLKEIGNE